MSEPPRALSTGLGNSNDQTRRHNLSTIMTMIHRGGAQTRAELTRRSGLNRSTIAALIMELSDLGLAYETAPTGPGTVGRPSPYVHPNDRVATIAINPDVDAIIIGLVGLGGKVHKRVRSETAGVPTVQEALETIRVIVEEMRNGLDSDFRIVGAGLAVPGLVRSDDGLVTLAPHLGWRNEPLAERVSEALGCPAVAANDANVAVVAESLYGAGRGVSDLVYLNGSSSGIGGGVLVGSTPLRGAVGYGAELGHTLAKSAGELCDCGKHGCLETEVNMQRLLAVLGRDSVDADELDSILSGAANRELGEEVDRQVDVLAESIASLISVFNPEVIVLGGFLGSLYAARPERLQQGARRASFSPLAVDVRIERAQLRSRLLIVGAAELAFGALLADPASFATLSAR